MSLQRIIVTNPKGGCGKTTITTNIASHYALQGKKVRLFDHDTQSSSLAWIRRRDEGTSEIVGVDASKNSDHRLTKSWQLRVPPETQVALIDSPAGTDITELAALFQKNDSVLIPVLPSPIDIHATAHFIKELLTTGGARKRMIRLAVIATGCARIRSCTMHSNAFCSASTFPLFQACAIPSFMQRRLSWVLACRKSQAQAVKWIVNNGRRYSAGWKRRWSPRALPLHLCSTTANSKIPALQGPFQTIVIWMLGGV